MRSTTQVPLQLQQPGCGLVRTPADPDERWLPLGPGARRPLHWPAGTNAEPQALAVNLRVSEPGWSWSGAVGLGALQPGELLVKVCGVAWGEGLCGWPGV